MNLAMTRIRFRENAITTAGPQQILTMLYDRLVLDLARAEAAQRAGDRGEANKQVDHAQDIISGLASTLEVDEWSGGRGLMDLYMYLLKELARGRGPACCGRPDTDPEPALAGLRLRRVCDER